MAFHGVNFPAGFFDLPGATTPSAASSGPQGLDRNDPNQTGTQFTRGAPVPATPIPPPTYPGAASASRPHLTPIHIPRGFSATLNSPASAGTPDSGYGSAFGHRTPAFTRTFDRFRSAQPSPASPLDQRSRNPQYPQDLPDLFDCELSDDEEDDEEEDIQSQNGAIRLLKLYKAGHVTAEAGENGCWKIQCNRCTHWVKTSIPTRTPLSSSGQFSGVESHQTGNKCMYSPKFVRGATAPPAAHTEPDDAMDIDDDFDFAYGRSSSAPPEDIASRTASTQRPPDSTDNTTHPTLNDLPRQTASPNSPFESQNSADTPRPCSGVFVNWNIAAGSAGWTFPWHRVIQGGNSQTEFFRVEIDREGVTRAFSKKCGGPTAAADICVECEKIPGRLLELEGYAMNPKTHTNHRFLNYLQLTNLLADKDSELRRIRLKCANLTRKLGNCIKKLTDYRRLAFAVAESNYPRLTQLLSAGLRNGASPRKLINLLGDVVEGTVKYTPRPSTDSRTIDISLMAYILGGRKLLYALCHGSGLPSLRTLRRHMAFTRIMPTIGTISLSDITHNIEEVVLKPRAAAGRTKPRGVSLLIDETALLGTLS
ncbi:hypothetical protein FB451DRAFT_1513375 [Mycena latifolia]|nr:hypothetical protein FB451DRAFT_1513375 [Mycena latifolia]